MPYRDMTKRGLLKFLLWKHPFFHSQPGDPYDVFFGRCRVGGTPYGARPFDGVAERILGYFLCKYRVKCKESGVNKIEKKAGLYYFCFMDCTVVFDG